VINPIHVQEVLVGGNQDHLHKDWEKKTRFGHFDLSLPFLLIINGATGQILRWFQLGWKLDFHTFPTIYGPPFNFLIQERTIHLKLGIVAARQNAKITELVLLN
jgi:hypothetical protein